MQVLMICSIKISLFDKTFDLMLVQWYDSKCMESLYDYLLTSQYEFVPVETAVKLVHVVPRFIKKDNEYFVNVFMF